MKSCETNRCKRGHERPAKGACIECCRERARAYAAAHKEERAAYQAEYRAKKPARRLCKKGLHERRPSQKGACGPCVAAAHAAKRPATCKSGHPRVSPGKCRECQIAYLREWSVANVDRQREYRRANRKKRTEQAKAWRKKWRAAHPDLANAEARNGYSRNPEAHKAAVMRWRRNHPERWRALADRGVAKRRAVKAGVIGSHTQAEWEKLISHYHGKCVYCGAKGKLTKDHVIPLSRGGTDYIWNIKPACKSCNSRKRDRLEPDAEFSLFDGGDSSLKLRADGSPFLRDAPKRSRAL